MGKQQIGIDSHEIKEVCLVCGGTSWELIGEHQEFSGSYIILCPKCKFMTTSPLPSEFDVEQHYRKFYREQERKVSFYYRQSQKLRARSQFRFIKKYLDRPMSGLRVLEIGAGIGCLLNNFAIKGARVNGFEPRQELADFAMQKFDLSLIVSPFDLKKVAEKRYDIILLSHVLEHILELPVFIQGLKQIISKNGFLFIEIPNENKVKIHNRIVFQYKTDSHVHFFNPTNINRFMEQYAFKSQRLLTVGEDTETIQRNSSDRQNNSWVKGLHQDLIDFHRKSKGIWRNFSAAVLKCLSGFIYLSVIFQLVANNPNFKYYNPSGRKQGNWIRSLWKLQ
ncbi:MAG: class I SAM-dependent methyltransferase [Desulfobacter sp.]|nr:MAG: class I SAM-dependent methyltransferase [Desulfobacter sp.]